MLCAVHTYFHSLINLIYRQFPHVISTAIKLAYCDWFTQNTVEQLFIDLFVLWRYSYNLTIMNESCYKFPCFVI